jgi:hypothetical protein
VVTTSHGAQRDGYVRRTAQVRMAGETARAAARQARAHR